MNATSIFSARPSCGMYEVVDFLEPWLASQVAEEADNIVTKSNKTDLHSFRQSDDLIQSTDIMPPGINYLREILDTVVRSKLESLYLFNSIPKITMTVSKYTNGDFLLCHDDQFNDRHIAFVYYLTPDWTAADGGQLRFFNHDDDFEPINMDYKEIVVPQFNQLVVFEVNEMSHHEVQQVWTSKTRLSINGWFHSGMNEITFPHFYIRSPMFQFLSEPNREMNFNNLVDHAIWSNKQFRIDMHNEIKSSLVLSYQQFLPEEIYNECLSELERNDLAWTLQGPSNHRKYETLPVNLSNGDTLSLPEGLSFVEAVTNFLVSSFWLNCLNDITGKEYIVTSENSHPPVCLVEVQRWKPGFYTVLADNDGALNSSLVEVTIFLGVKNSHVPNETEDDLFLNDINSGCLIFYKDCVSMRKAAMRTLRNQKKKRLVKEMLKKYGPIDEKANDLIHKRASDMASEKIERIAQYRARTDDAIQTYVPSNNNIVISINSNHQTRFTAYIPFLDSEEENDVCYYAINVSYMMQ